MDNIDNIDNQKPTPISMPNSNTILILGILSIFLNFCCCVGWILSIITLSISAGYKKKYNQNPEVYTSESFKNIKSGRICSIVGLALFGLIIMLWLIILLSPELSTQIQTTIQNTNYY